ncbi:hypothetical protein L6452_03551 [Arctium lappa]|uniref:Uncharacterized protein n=1 Tax=Arctium lappa TaxID=4217 RepID=A0ACB9FNH0_ARCLA|nr:hypothetical protein L6452_03551 [Arctium lappa]
MLLSLLLLPKLGLEVNETSMAAFLFIIVHYEFNFVTGCFDPLHPESKDNPNVNLSILLEWSPYSTDEELLKQEQRNNNMIGDFGSIWKESNCISSIQRLPINWFIHAKDKQEFNTTKLEMGSHHRDQPE